MSGEGNTEEKSKQYDIGETSFVSSSGTIVRFNGVVVTLLTSGNEQEKLGTRSKGI